MIKSSASISHTVCVHLPASISLTIYLAVRIWHLLARSTKVWRHCWYRGGEWRQGAGLMALLLTRSKLTQHTSSCLLVGFKQFYFAFHCALCSCRKIFPRSQFNKMRQHTHQKRGSTPTRSNFPLYSDIMLLWFFFAVFCMLNVQNRGLKMIYLEYKLMNLGKVSRCSKLLPEQLQQLSPGSCKTSCCLHVFWNSVQDSAARGCTCVFVRSCVPTRVFSEGCIELITGSAAEDDDFLKATPGSSDSLCSCWAGNSALAGLCCLPGTRFTFQQAVRLQLWSPADFLIWLRAGQPGTRRLRGC